MSLVSMAGEVHGAVPKIPWDYCFTLVNRAYADLRRKNLWSFQLFEANWTSPPIVNAGTATVTPGSKTVVFDTAAAAAINLIGLFPSSVAQRQFRVGAGTIYNIWSWDGANTATLDRLYQEAAGSGVAYMIYQTYYPAPMQDFLCWLDVKEMTNMNDLVTTQTRAWLNQKDPQRTVYYLPTHVIPYQQDQNPASATYRWPLFELWGSPVFQLTYQLYGIRRGLPLVNDTDELPPALGEDCVLALAKKYAYEWAEANKGDVPRGVGSDYRFLMEETKSDFKRLYGEYRKDDRELVDNWRTRLRRTWTWPSLNGYYSSIAGVANPGAAW